MFYLYGNDRKFHKISTVAITVPMLLFVLLLAISVLEGLYSRAYEKTYREALSTIKNGEPSYTVKDRFINRDAVLYACFGNPETFFIDGIRYRYQDGKITYFFTYNDSMEDYDEMLVEYRVWVQNLARQVPAGLSDRKKVAWLHDYLCEHFSYGGDHSAYHMIRTGQGVCSAYAKLFSSLLTEVGIENHYIRSEAMNHAWNLVLVNHEWLHVDVTWDDSSDSRRYFLLTDPEILEEGHYDFNDISQTSLKLDSMKAVIRYAVFPLWLAITLGTVGYILFLKKFIKPRNTVVPESLYRPKE